MCSMRARDGGAYSSILIIFWLAAFSFSTAFCACEQGRKLVGQRGARADADVSAR